MKRKTNSICRENPTKLLFKSSCKSINTYSKTYSGASQLCTKSLVLQLQKKLPKTKFYEDQGKIKRDLSIETDICIMRRYYKKKRNKFSNREAISAKSKYSTIFNEADIINNFTRDNSACGDSEVTTNQEIPRYKVNITSLVVNNLKKLLNDWITKYLFENNETKQKIDSVLDSILHKLDLQRNDTSSCTYTIDVELGDQLSKRESQSTISKDQKLYPEQSIEVIAGQNSSYLTIPLTNRYVQVISTLSIPRNSQNRKKTKSLHKIKKFRYKKVVLSMSKSSKYLLTSSSLNFLTLRAKSLTKHCATYEKNDTEVDLANDKFLPNNILADDSVFTETVSRNNIENKNICKTSVKKIPSIYKNIYGITSVHVKSFQSLHSGNNQSLGHLSEDKNVDFHGPLQGNKIISENEQSDQLITIDFGKQSNEVSNLDIKTKRNDDNDVLKPTNKSFEDNILKSRMFNHKTIKSKQFSYLIKKSNNRIKKQRQLLNNFHTIFKYFSNYRGKKDMQLHIKVKLCAKNENKEDTQIPTSYAHILCSKPKEIKSPKEDTAEIPKLNSQNIISLLDGATSETKYLVKENLTDTLNDDNTISNTNSESITNRENYKIVHEIGELKGIIQSLANTADQLISNHLYKQNKVSSKSNHFKNKSDNISQNIIYQNAIKQALNDSAVVKPSKGIQVSTTPRSQIRSGFKLRKEPKKKEFSVTPMKKPTSYRIIPSESLIKVTDMTSAAQNMRIKSIEKMKDNALTCSLPKSKSLYEISIGPNKRKLFALYCDDYTKQKSYIYNMCDSMAPCISVQQNKCCHSEYSDNNICLTEPKLTCTDCVSTNSNCELIEEHNSDSSVCIEIDSRCCLAKNFIIRNREGLTFWEGLLYCVLLWIPVLLVSWFFYVNVIKNLVKQDNNLAQTKIQKLSETTNPPKMRALAASSIYHGLSLSDLGF